MHISSPKKYFRIPQIVGVLALTIFSTIGISSAAMLPGQVDSPGNFYDTYILDAQDNSTTNVTLQFGSTLSKLFYYDKVNNRFTFNDASRVEGNLAIIGQEFVAADHAAASSAGILNLGRTGSSWNTIQWDTVAGSFTTNQPLLVGGNLSANGNTITLDQDNTGGNIKVQFGQSLNKSITWNSTTSLFDINAPLNITGGITVSGNIDYAGNQSVNMRVENLASAPTCNSGAKGRVYINTTDNKTYSCNGTTWDDLVGSKVITVGTSQEYSTIASAATYLATVGGGIMLLTPETHSITTSVNLNNVTLMGREPDNTIVQVSGPGVITTTASLFKNLTLSDVATSTGTRMIDLSAGATQARFEDIRVTIGDASDALIGSSALIAPTPTITFSQSEQTGANGFVLQAIASSGLNAATKVIVANAAANNLLKINNWPVTIRFVGNVLTSGLITPVPANEIKLYPGMNIQGAVNSLPSGGTISMLAGTYNITSPIQISSSNITLSGSGDGTIISESSFAGLPNAQTAAIQVGATDGSAPVNNITLKDFKLNINENIHGIHITGGDDNQVVNLSIQKVAGTAGSGSTAIIGILVTDSSAAVVSRPVIRNNRITGNGGTISFTDGIHVSGDTAIAGLWGFNQGVVSALVEGNNVDYIRETGYLIINARGSSLFNNRVRRTGVNGATGSLGIWISRASNLSMVANVLTGTLDGSGQAICIECFSAGGARTTIDSVFTNNLIDGNADSGSGFLEGITLGNTSTVTAHRNIIQGNSVRGAAASGTTRAVSIDGDADDNVVADNSITGGTNSWLRGVTISAATGERNVVKSQRYSSVTTPMSNSGTSTQFGTTTTDASNVPSVATELMEEWNANAVAGNMGWATTVSGAAAAASMDTTNITQNHPGIVQLTTGTTATGRASIHQGGATTIAGGGITVFETSVRIPALSTGAQEYALRIGLGDLATGDFVDGIYFEYNRPTSVNWIIKTANNSTRSSTTTTTAVAAGAATWTKLRAEVDSAGGSVQFFVNGTSVGTITSATTIPITTGRVFSPYVQMIKSVGTTAAILSVDYYYFRKEFSTAR